MFFHRVYRSYPPAAPIVWSRALMVEMAAHTRDSRNRDTNMSPNEMLLNSSSMYWGMMKSVPSPIPVMYSNAVCP